jgi:hypothetical protein
MPHSARPPSRRACLRALPLVLAAVLAAWPAAGQPPTGYAGAGLSVSFVGLGPVGTQSASNSFSVAFSPTSQPASVDAALSVGFSTAPLTATANASVSVGFSTAPIGETVSGGFGVAFNPSPVPTIVALLPPQVHAGRGAFRLTAQGADFFSGATLFWNGSPRTTTWVTPTEVRAAIPPEDVASVGTASVTVENPTPNLGPSNASPFTISTSAPTFTDDPLTVAVTTVKVVHVTELRQQVDQLRARYGLSGFAWTDGTLQAGATPVKAVHLLELRTALGEVCVVAGETPPVYTDPAVVAGKTVVSAAHLTEIRALIARLW